MRSKLLHGLALVALSLGAGTGVAQVRGQVELRAQGKPLRAETAAEVVLYFRPSRRDALPSTLPVPAQAPQMRTERKQFQPRALPVTAGTTVVFPNMDPILHNVFSSGPRVRFDLGVYGGGETRTQRFDSPGLVRVYCNVHHDMVGHVLVLDTPWFGRPDSSGRFTLEVPAGTAGELFAWHERAGLWRQRLVAGVEAEVAVAMELDRPRVPRHMNKFGKPYGNDRARGY